MRLSQGELISRNAAAMERMRGNGLRNISFVNMKMKSSLRCFKVLCDRASVYNHRVMVTEDEATGVRTLFFGSEFADRQAVFDSRNPSALHLPYVRVLSHTVLAMSPKRRVLMVGLGAGTIPSLVAREWGDATCLDVVEIDPVVAETAREHLGFVEAANLHVIVKDGRREVASRSVSSVDLFVLDAYGPQGQPRELATVEFLQEVRRIVEPDKGVVVANVFGSESNARYGAMLASWEHVFEDVLVLGVPDSSNKILVATRGDGRPGGRKNVSYAATLLRD